MITISQVQEQEIPEVKKLLSHTWRHTYGHLYSNDAIEKITSTWHDQKALLQQARDPNRYFAVAKDETGKIIGIITMSKTDEETIFMNRLYVHPDAQGKGIGSQLLKKAEAYFKDVKKIRLECEKQNNNACAFYLKQGFTIVGEKNETLEGVTTKTREFEKKITK